VLAALAAGKQVDSELTSVCVWVKGKAVMDSLYRNQHELVCVFQSGKGSHRNDVESGQHGRHRTNVWRYPGVNSLSRSTDKGDLLESHRAVRAHPPQTLAAHYKRPYRNCPDHTDLPSSHFCFWQSR
jgi:hypothetical protein